MKYTLDQLIAFESSLDVISGNLLVRAEQLQHEEETRLLGSVPREELEVIAYENPEVKSSWIKYKNTLKVHNKIRERIALLAYELIDEIDKNLEV